MDFAETSDFFEAGGVSRFGDVVEPHGLAAFEDHQSRRYLL